jgi:hypothetical protein
VGRRVEPRPLGCDRPEGLIEVNQAGLRQQSSRPSLDRRSIDSDLGPWRNPRQPEPSSSASDSRSEVEYRLASLEQFGARPSQRLSEFRFEPRLEPHTLRPVPESFDRVVVNPIPPELEIPREAWKILIARLEGIPATGALVEKLRRVGAGRSVDLTSEEEAVIRQVTRDWEAEVGSANLPPSIRELRDELRNFVLAYSRGEVEIQWDPRNQLLDRLRRYPAAADIVPAVETPGSHLLHLTDEQMAVLRDVVVAWLDEVGVSRLPPGIYRLRGALQEHMRDVQRRDLT